MIIFEVTNIKRQLLIEKKDNYIAPNFKHHNCCVGAFSVPFFKTNFGIIEIESGIKKILMNPITIRQIDFNAHSGCIENSKLTITVEDIYENYDNDIIDTMQRAIIFRVFSLDRNFNLNRIYEFFVKNILVNIYAIHGANEYEVNEYRTPIRKIFMAELEMIPDQNLYF